MRGHPFVGSLICFALLSFGASAATRPEVGKPLQEALKLAAAHNYKAAMARVDAADKVANKSDQEMAEISEIRTYIDRLTTVPCKGQECRH